MRIVYLNPGGRLGGAETSLRELLASVRAAEPDWELWLVLGEDGPLAAIARGLGVRVLVQPFPPALARLGDSGRWTALVGLLKAAVPTARYARDLSRWLAKIQPDIIHTNGFKMHLLGAWTRPRQTPLIWHIHDYVSPRRLMRRLLWPFRKACSVAIVNSRSVAKDLEQVLPGLRIVPIYNAIDLERFSPQGGRLDLDARAGLAPPAPGTVRVGLIATFARWKGHKVFLEALARVSPDVPIRGYIIGGPIYQTDGSQWSALELQKEAERLGLAGQVGFTGFLEDIPAAMRSLDIVVHASTQPEPFGMVIIEGMACGAAVIASQAGGASEIFSDGEDALGHPPGDAAVLAQQILRLASDQALRRRLGQAGRATAERLYHGTRLANELVALYRKISNAPVAEAGPGERSRILHVNSGNLYGGVESILVTLARLGHLCPHMESHFAVCHEGRLSRELMEAGAPVYRLGQVRISRPWTVWRARRQLREILRSEHFDLVICHMPWSFAVFGPAVKAAGQRLGFCAHAFHSGRGWLEWLARRITPDLAIANSNYTESGLANLFPQSPHGVIYPPVELTAFSSAGQTRSLFRQQQGLNEATVVIIQVSRIEACKGHLVHLEALGRLKQLPTPWVCWMVGGAQRPEEREYLNQLERTAAVLGLQERVRFLGQRADIPALLAAADIFCQPNETPDSFGISFVEALSAGRPVVTSALGGALEIVDESCGLLVQPGDVAGLAAALQQLIERPELRADLTRSGAARALALCDPAKQMGLLDRMSRARRNGES